jgi:transposase
VPATSKIGKAFTYFTTEYEHLIGYFKDGRLAMDSGFVERCIRKFAIGRNNWLFSETEAGAEGSELLYSLVITAKVNGVNPYWALKYIFEEIPKTQSLEEIERLADIIVGAQPTP